MAIAAALCSSATVRQTSTMSVRLNRRKLRRALSSSSRGCFQDPQERVSCLAPLVDQCAILLVHMLADDVEDLQNPVHRRSHFMAHIGQESRLGVVSLLGR